MIYTVKCHTCGKKGKRGVYSNHIQPDGWIVIGWQSSHSEHLETVCSIECLNKFEVHKDDVPKEEVR